jgi:hypothetical protein
VRVWWGHGHGGDGIYGAAKGVLACVPRKRRDSGPRSDSARVRVGPRWETDPTPGSHLATIERGRAESGQERGFGPGCWAALGGKREGGEGKREGGGAGQVRELGRLWAERKERGRKRKREESWAGPKRKGGEDWAAWLGRERKGERKKKKGFLNKREASKFI